MKKEKQKTEIKFNPAEYDYMDEMLLAGWIWEFIRRNKSYQQHFSMKEKDNKYNFDCFNLFGLIPHRYYRQLPKESPDQNNYLLITGQSFDNSIFIPSLRKIAIYEYFPNPDRRYCDFGTHKPLIAGLLSVKCHDFRNDLILSNLDSKEDAYHKQCYHVLTHNLAINDPKDTLYLGISKNAKIDDIKREIEAILQQYIKPKKNNPRVRLQKWKEYLMTYDLIKKNNNISFTDVADCFTEKVPNKIFGYFDDRNCNNFYKNAVMLINGDYKKYLITK